MRVLRGRIAGRPTRGLRTDCAGAPVLTATGSPLDLRLGGAAASAPCGPLLGAAAGGNPSGPSSGALIVPSLVPPSSVVPLVADPTGAASLSLAAMPPGVPTGIELAFQAVIAAANGVAAFSNAELGVN